MAKQSFNRAIQLGLLAKEMAMLRFWQRSETRSGKARTAVVNRLGSLHGIPQKLGQILSLGELTQTDPNYAVLTEAPPSLPFETIQKQMQDSLGESCLSSFSQIEEEGISASIAQVHQAQLPDGSDVAIKVRYPGIAEGLHLDLKALGWLTAPVGDLRRGFDIAAYRKEIGSMLEMEIDFQAEAKNLTKFTKRFEEWDQVQSPCVVDSLSNDKILTMTWVKGENISVAREWSVQERAEISRLLLKLFLSSCLRWKEVHADPHPGNYRFQRNGGNPILGLIDFGCVKCIDEDIATGMASLLKTSLDGDYDREKVLSAYLKMGFNSEMLRPMEHLLVDTTKILLAPFGDHSFSIADWRLSEKISKILGDFRQNFRLAGPPDIIYIIRAFQGMVQYLKALDAPFNWRETLAEILADQKGIVQPEAPPQIENKKRFMLSETLNIQVRENGMTKIKLTFGAAAVECLADLIPDELRESLENRAIDLEKISSQAMAYDLPPGDLFKTEEGNKRVRVWLQ